MNSSGAGPIILITGGSGFLGRAVLRELAATSPVLSPCEIRILDLRPPPPDPEIAGLPIVWMKGDICDPAAVATAVRGVDIVLHAAALVDWGTHPAAMVRQVNTTAVQTMVDACIAEKVRTLVYTSSLDAIFTGKPIVDADEDWPVPKSSSSNYGKSKAAAEQIVRGANGKELSTVVLRPSGIYGEWDPYHISNLAAQAKSGFYARIGNGRTRCMHIYVGNAAHAHLLAAKALHEGNRASAGKVYFLVDSPPKNFFVFLERILEKAGVRIWPKNLWIPGWVLYPFALAAEAAAFFLRPVVRIHPKLSRFAISYICNDFTLKGDRAAIDFGFLPKYTEDAAVERSAAWLRTHGPARL